MHLDRHRFYRIRVKGPEGVYQRNGNNRALRFCCGFKAAALKAACAIACL